MKHLYIHRAGVLALKTGFVALGGLALWLMSGIAAAPALWYLYALAAFGAFCGGCLLLGVAIEAEDELARLEARRRAVPAPRIERSVRHGR